VSPAGKKGSEREAFDEGLWLEPGEAEPGLLLFALLGQDGIGPELETALAEGAVAALVADASGLAADARRSALAAALAACHRWQTALLVRNDAAAARAADADGVHLDDPGKIAAARGLLAGDKVVGAACGRSRHTAMVAGEAGADYVMVGALDQTVESDDELLELVAWWNELFVIPCAVAGRMTPDRAAVFVRAGADLVAVSAAGGDIAGLARALREAGPRRDPDVTQG
jgi:thiamine-phosphate pyrophosphorylase